MTVLSPTIPYPFPAAYEIMWLISWINKYIIKSMPRKSSLFSGFTVIEVIIAVTAVSLFTTFLTLSNNFKNSLGQAKDTKRKTDLQKLNTALSDYYLDTGCLPTFDEWLAFKCGEQDNGRFSSYIKSFPCDPENQDKYYYQPLDANCSPCNGGCGVCVGYRLLTSLQNKNDSSIKTVGCDPALGCGITDSQGDVQNFGHSMKCPVSVISVTPVPPQPSTIPSTLIPPIPSVTSTGPSSIPSTTVSPTPNASVTPSAFCTLASEWGLKKYYPELGYEMFSSGSLDNEFRGPEGVEISPDGYVYIADAINYKVKKFTKEGIFVSSIPIICRDVNCSTNVPNAGEPRPYDITFDSSGNIYVVSSWLNQVQKFDPNGNFLLSWGSITLRNNDGGNLNMPDSLVSDRNGYIYVSNRWGDRIVKFDENGNYIKAFGSSGSGPGQLEMPMGLEMDKDGNLNVAEFSNARISVFTTDGDYVSAFGSMGCAEVPPGTASIMPPGKMCQPHDLAVDKYGNKYVSDTLNHRIQKFDRSGNFIFMWGYFDYAKPNATSYPYGIAVDDQENIYFSSYSKIAKYSCN